MPLGLLLAAGTLHAQLKAPSQSAPRSGTGLVAPPAERGAANPAAATPEKPAAQSEAGSSDSILQTIADCMLVGLPRGWRTAQVQVIQLSSDGKTREFEAKYFHTSADEIPVPYRPCDAREPAMNVYRLNGALDADKRNWTRATLTLSSEGKFELKYDYSKQE